MKRFEKISKKKGSVTTIVEEYSSFADFTETVSGRRLCKWVKSDHGDRAARRSEDPGWRRCENIGEARDFLLHGFDEDVERLVGRVNTLQRQGTRAKTKRFKDVVGYQPIVPNAILGLPNSMMNSKKVPVKSKVVTILYNPSVSCATSKEQVLEFGARLLSHIMNLEKNGYRVRLEYVCPIQEWMGGRGLQYVLRIPIKSEKNPLNIKRVAFPISHVGMFRYLAFDWYESLPKSQYLPGYGTVYASCHNKLKKNFADMLKPTEYMVQYEDDLDAVFGEIK